ncbi:MAG: response regulator transcription factor [Deltaproteobacteria bacterium]|nr:response regulator transcription factor [Deltaproteobacteria bacterium]
MALPAVLLVEDDAATRARLRAVIEAHAGLALAGAVGSCAEARAALAGAAPAVLLTDIGLPDGSGIDLIRELRGRGLPTLCMVVTVFGDEPHVVSAIEAGALGYLLKDAPAEAIGGAILEMLAGGSPMSAPVARFLLKRFEPAPAAPAPPAPASGAPTPGPGAPTLSAREREVLGYIVKGFTYGEIARLTGLSAHTVATYVRRVYGKLEVHSRGEAVYEALASGLVGVDG